MLPDEAALVRQSGAALGTRVDDDSLQRIGRYLDVLDTWNRGARLTGERDRASIVARHVVDSLTPTRWLPPFGLVIDVGSGAGFPGIVLGCLRPELDLALIESRRRRASFLGEVIRTIPLPRARVVGRRAEEAAAGDLRASAQAVITRAVRLDTFISLAATLLVPAGVAIAMQTPGAVGTAGGIAARVGFRLEDTFEYPLPGGRRRALLLFRRAQ